MTVWLVEHDVGGYDYGLLEIFYTQPAAQQFVDWYTSTHSHQPTIRQVEVLTFPNEPPADYREYRPLWWGR